MLLFFSPKAEFFNYVQSYFPFDRSLIDLSVSMRNDALEYIETTILMNIYSFSIYFMYLDVICISMLIE